jgi:hypothetical protein
MKIRELKVEQVYRGADGTTRRILDLGGQECIFVGPDGYRRVWDKRKFAHWAQEQVPITEHLVDGDMFLKSCPGCESFRVLLSKDLGAVFCFKCGFVGPHYLDRMSRRWAKARKVSKWQQIYWWNGLGRVEK